MAAATASGRSKESPARTPPRRFRPPSASRQASGEPGRETSRSVSSCARAFRARARSAARIAAGASKPRSSPRRELRQKQRQAERAPPRTAAPTVVRGSDERQHTNAQRATPPIRPRPTGVHCRASDVGINAEHQPTPPRDDTTSSRRSMDQHLAAAPAMPELAGAIRRVTRPRQDRHEFRAQCSSSSWLSLATRSNASPGFLIRY